MAMFAAAAAPRARGRARTATPWPRRPPIAAAARAAAARRSAAECATPAPAARCWRSPRRTASRWWRPPPGGPCVPHDHPLYGGALGIIGVGVGEHPRRARPTSCWPSAPGCRTSPPSSWTASPPDVRIVTRQRRPLRRRQARRATPSSATPARRCVELDGAARRLDGATAAWAARAAARDGRAGTPTSTGCGPATAPDGSLTYAQVRRRRQRRAAARTTTSSTASGGMPGELHGGWRTGAVDRAGRPPARRWTSSTASPAWATRSSAPWGAAMARGADPSRTGWSRRLSRRRLLPDAQLRALLRGVRRASRSSPWSATTAGYAVIHRLQTGQGADGLQQPVRRRPAGPGADGGAAGRLRRARPVRWAAPSRTCRPAAGVDDAPRGVRRAPGPRPSTTRRPAVVVCRTHPSTWTEAGAWWEVGVPAALPGRSGYEAGKSRQLRWTAGFAPGYRDGGQRAALQGGGEGPRGRAFGPERALAERFQGILSG